ncbi:hypothetical protein M0805_009598 [Coniferiporia weirii]|nr:hypothetical protein M0805_009598 [Coniferiporia weirii]
MVKNQDGAISTASALTTHLRSPFTANFNDLNHKGTLAKMYADLDELVLSGRLFNGGSRSSSPARTPSPDRSPARNWPDAIDNGEEDDGGGNDSDAERERRISQIMRAAPQDAPAGAIGMGPGRTGVKGVIRDRAEAQERARALRAAEIAALNRRMEKASLGGKTFLEEEREREWERAMLEGLSTPGTDAVRRGAAKGGRFGHLREVGVKNFVSAVENEARGVWVVVHLYDPSLDRCYTLDAELAQLARLHPDVKLLRARAAALGFASSSSSRAPSLSRPAARTRTSRLRPIADADDEDDPYAYAEKDVTDEGGYDDDDDDEEEEGNVDVDVLPTLLAYRDGELVHTWVRVDWEAGRAGVAELLTKHHILRSGNCGLPDDNADDDDDDDDDLWASDGDAS